MTKVLTFSNNDVFIDLGSGMQTVLFNVAVVCNANDAGCVCNVTDAGCVMY